MQFTLAQIYTGGDFRIFKNYNGRDLQEKVTLGFNLHGVTVTP